MSANSVTWQYRPQKKNVGSTEDSFWPRKNHDQRSPMPMCWVIEKSLCRAKKLRINRLITPLLRVNSLESLSAQPSSEWRGDEAGVGVLEEDESSVKTLLETKPKNKRLERTLSTLRCKWLSPRLLSPVSSHGFFTSGPEPGSLQRSNMDSCKHFEISAWSGIFIRGQLRPEVTSWDCASEVIVPKLWSSTLFGVCVALLEIDAAQPEMRYFC